MQHLFARSELCAIFEEYTQEVLTIYNHGEYPDDDVQAEMFFDLVQGAFDMDRLNSAAQTVLDQVHQRLIDEDDFTGMSYLEKLHDVGHKPSDF